MGEIGGLNRRDSYEREIPLVAIRPGVERRKEREIKEGGYRGEDGGEWLVRD